MPERMNVGNERIVSVRVVLAKPKRFHGFAVQFRSLPAYKNNQRWNDITIHTDCVGTTWWNSAWPVSQAEGARAVGEVSPAYLAALRVPDRIARSLPDARIIAILRNPIDRVVSRYVARRRDGLEQAIDLETVVEREGRPWAPIEDAAGTYVAAGFVSHVLERYLELFPREQVRLYLYEELASDAASLLRDLFAFLGVDPDLPIDVSAVHNRSGGEISAPLRRLLWTRTAALRTRIRPYLQGAARDRAFAIVARDRRSVAIPASLYSQFISIYGDEVRKLEQILDRDLSHWLRPSTDQG